ncbi:hypothetical protein IL306_013117 [Fusarium sp. DS 682]|nr:hypothetical protein IL306_013117 [Fusarium sp. DS 682]
MNRLIAESKHKGTSETILESKSIQEIQALDKKAINKMNRSMRSAGRMEKLPNLNSEFGDPVDFGTSRGKAYPVEDVPLYLRSRKQNYPFGNVHVALRFGPLTFENGIASTHGVIITTRDLPELQVPAVPLSAKTSLKLTERNLEKERYSPKSSWTRTVYRQQRPRDTKRYKAMAKQIVGGAFCGFIDRKAELEIAETLIREGEGLELAGIEEELKQKLIKSSAQRVFEKVRNYLLHHVE